MNNSDALSIIDGFNTVINSGLQVSKFYHIFVDIVQYLSEPKNIKIDGDLLQRIYWMPLCEPKSIKLFIDQHSSGQIIKQLTKEQVFTLAEPTAQVDEPYLFCTINHTLSHSKVPIHLMNTIALQAADIEIERVTAKITCSPHMHLVVDASAQYIYHILYKESYLVSENISLKTRNKVLDYINQGYRFPLEQLKVLKKPKIIYNK